jgi:aminopeptidase N
VLLNTDLDQALAAETLILPSENYIGDAMQPIEPVAVHQARIFTKQTLAGELREHFWNVYRANQDDGPYRIDQQSIGRRALKNTCLSYLMELHDTQIRDVCYGQFNRANNMSDVVAALAALVNTECPEKDQALDGFYARWKEDALVVDKWLSLQATSRSPGTLQRVQALTRHEAFNIKNPNKVRALIGAFANGNPAQFHDPSGDGYRFVADYVLQLDALNPQLASRLVNVFTLWKSYNPERQTLMKQQLEMILSASKLSKDVYEIASKSLV